MTRLLDWLNRHGKAFAVRVRGVHPKHLVEVPGHAWYMQHLKPGLTLDVGSGTGHHAARAAQVADRVIAVDLRGPNSMARGVDFVRADLESPDLKPWVEDASVDTVLMLDILEHVTNRQGLLAEVRRVLKHDGLLLLSVPNRDTHWRWRLRQAGLFSYSDPDHKIEYTPVELYEELARAGFRARSWSATVYDTPWAGVMDALGALCLPLYRHWATWKHRMGARYPRESTGFRVVAIPA